MVNRYEIFHDGTKKTARFGLWVRYEDVEPLEAEVARLREALRKSDSAGFQVSANLEAARDMISRSVAILSEAVGTKGKVSLEGAVAAVYGKIVDLEREVAYLQGER